MLGVGEEDRGRCSAQVSAPRVPAKAVSRTAHPPWELQYVVCPILGQKSAVVLLAEKNILKMFRFGCYLESKIADISILTIFSIIYFKRETSKSVLLFSKLGVNFKIGLTPPPPPISLGSLESFDTCVNTGLCRACLT